MARKQDKSDGFLLPNVPTCIVACSGAEARLYLAGKRFGPWTLVETLENPDATLREQDHNSDTPGRSFDSFGRGRHAMSPEVSARQQDFLTFAQEIAQYLAKSHAAGQFNKLVLVAEPTFLGYLRRKLSATLKRELCCEVPKNPTDFDYERLRALFS